MTYGERENPQGAEGWHPPETESIEEPVRVAETPEKIRALGYKANKKQTVDGVDFFLVQPVEASRGGDDNFRIVREDGKIIGDPKGYGSFGSIARNKDGTISFFSNKSTKNGSELFEVFVDDGREEKVRVFDKEGNMVEDLTTERVRQMETEARRRDFPESSSSPK